MLATGGGAWYVPPQAATRSSRAILFTAFSFGTMSEPRARDPRLADVERFHPRRGKQLVQDQLAVARPERGGRERQQRQAPLGGRIHRPGALGPEIRIGGDAAALEIQLGERRRAVRETPSGAQRQRMLRRGLPLRGDSRTEPVLRADLVQANRRMQREARRERQIVADGGRDQAAPAPARGPMDPFATAGEEKVERVRLAHGQRQLALRARARGALVLARTVRRPVLAAAEREHSPQL